jgi:hypothetical protein
MTINISKERSEQEFTVGMRRLEEGTSFFLKTRIKEVLKGKI